MPRNIRSVLEEQLSHKKIDERLARQLVKYERWLIHKSEDNLEFIGGVLIGTPPFRIHDSDRNVYFDEILEIDDLTLRDSLIDLPSIDPSRKVTSDAFTISLTYLAHRFQALSGDIGHEAAKSALKVVHYRFLSSLMAHYFHYEADPRVAEATYAELNNRFSLKQAGSWAELIDQRCEDILSKDSIHRDAVERYDDDDAIIYWISDMQSRIREVVKRITAVFYEIRLGNHRVTERSQMVDLEGEMHLRDLLRKESMYRRYLYEVLGDPQTWVRSEIVSIIQELQPAVSEKRLREALQYLSDNFGSRGDSRIEKALEELLIHAFNFVRDNRKELRDSTNLAALIPRLRSAYLASRTKDSNLLEAKEILYEILIDALNSKNPNLVASVRTAVMLYTVTRMFAKDHYQS